MLLLGLGNKARQGKDFFAKYIQEYEPKVKLYSFAKLLKEHCRDHHKELLPLWQLANQTKQVPACKEDPIYGYTRILQWYGTNVVREKDPDHWVKKLDEILLAEKPEYAIITDVRFPNEAAYVKEKGGYTVQVRRQVKGTKTQMLDPGRDPNHPSEIALDNYAFDYFVVVEDGDLKGLQESALVTFKRIQSRGVKNVIAGFRGASTTY